ncbi:MAG: DUF2237 domain-containing protein [Planctomycetes bacterium]|nr:DUF2237 domain-containing protein [Planctomycetota bacterium]
MTDPRNPELNVLGTALEPCCTNPMTGIFRDGSCRTHPQDLGMHTVCVFVTADFLVFSKARGNDLTTPRLDNDFPGLVPGDRWCLCALRWVEAADANLAPPVLLEATHEKTLEVIDLERLKVHAVDPQQDDLLRGKRN